MSDGLVLVVESGGKVAHVSITVGKKGLHFSTEHDSFWITHTQLNELIEWLG